MHRDPTVVLRPVSELKLRQSLLLSDGKLSIYFTCAIAGPATVIAIGLILLPLYKLLWLKARH
jgi:putative tricarboxylic transport membrane protein